MRLFPRQLLVTCAIGGAGLLAPSAVIARQPKTQTLYMTALDKQGVPITDLEAGEIEAKAGGKAMEIVRMQPAQMPFRVAVIVSDAGIGGFQQGLANFMQKLLGKAEFGLISVVTQPEVVSEFFATPSGVSARGAGRAGPVRRSWKRFRRRPGALPAMAAGP